MNRLEEGHIRSIGSSFYKNVLLLTQMLPPCIEFQQHFRQGMFDRPNTAGFLHVSHYLSIVYDETLFKQTVRWPILCKKDEVTYRVEMKKFLFILSCDNPDINFPPILMSHLIQSGVWKKNILEKMQYVYRKNKELNELEESCDCLCKLILRISTNSGTLDANMLPKINCNNFLLEHTINNSYTNGSIISFSTLLTLLYLTSVQMLYHINAADFSDLSPCLPFIQNSCKEMKFLQTLFIALNTRINSIFRDEQRDSRENENAYNSDIIGKLLLTTNYKILQSPKINFNLNECVDDNLFYEKLCSSMRKQGKHKYLFKRYANKYHPSQELPTALSDFGSSWSSMSGWLSPRAHFIKCEQILLNGKPLSPLYSQLLCSRLNVKRSRENVLHSSSYEGLNLTPRKRRSISRHVTTHKYNVRVRDLFNSAATSSLSYVSSDLEN